MPASLVLMSFFRKLRLGTILMSFIHPPLTLPRLRFIGGAFTPINDQWQHTLCSPFWRMYYNHDAGAWIDHPQGRLHLQPEIWYLLPAWGTFHSGCSGLVRHLYIHVEISDLEGLVQEEALSQPQTLPQDPLLSDLASRTKSMSDWRWATALAHAVFAAWISSLGAKQRQSLDEHLSASDPLRPALQLLEQHISDPLPVESLAKACEMSVDTLSRLVRRRFGRSPAAWIRRRRCARAAELLASSTKSIEVIAQECGFANRDHFSRVFSHFFGSGPAEHRRIAGTWHA